MANQALPGPVSCFGRGCHGGLAGSDVAFGTLRGPGPPSARLGLWRLVGGLQDRTSPSVLSWPPSGAWLLLGGSGGQVVARGGLAGQDITF